MDYFAFSIGLSRAKMRACLLALADVLGGGRGSFGHPWAARCDCCDLSQSERKRTCWTPIAGPIATPAGGKGGHIALAGWRLSGRRRVLRASAGQGFFFSAGGSKLYPGMPAQISARRGLWGRPNRQGDEYALTFFLRAHASYHRGRGCR